ncbi:bifunctional 23S rRNA (guanine(2069)-N(7))-methyltransferase RlmK/23S rRNA (guanine(2445)-N(2))-methyltransferase RlmL [Moraxella haemolytica]|uniref:bifunctional 23S rRNA (guanine(2069)-N(7))-methyltransferase RlmK/23S rRNA (guanine(2445)-N(2))-methyltransferase RlmL n=1 Tax=Moraxella haemolytica TaxID=2904119 RepID=UPI0025435F79|nr:bifunctional 23S rRNA (guanine(2069)-N(7))-methyltransferase RlmK/23S rRNA (guanine(2445)-N(2))-methyltransferase RlmL [Moraxella sp. ZY171148]WII96021.1 bifunctional 23S rRNA (guanine(2069)-N(7))-methyltransferase RlmK/23S rRNA (guanine(2445)-N(2))-methyltransferase RlmL [Moraxella sp. ZY171148]
MSSTTPVLINPFCQFDTRAFELVLTCADGLENALLIELKSFGIDAHITRVGRVRATVGLSQFYHLCLYSRVASRILLPIGEYHFKQKQTITNQISKDDKGRAISRTIQTQVIDEDVPEALYQFTARYDWTQIFDLDHSFAIRLSTDKRMTINQQFATLRIKDAIVDTFNRKLGARPDVSKTPDIHIFAVANNQFAELFLDLSGTSLHRRGYRVVNTAAPLKENLAAALLYECGWHTGQHDALIDPMCGSGTFITEAMLMRADYPVGLDKTTNEFGFYHWAYHDDALWQQQVMTANDRFHANLDKLSQNMPTVIALDADATAVHACHQNLMASGLSPIINHITLRQQPLSALKDTLAKLQASNPLLITNPPYGERLGEADFIKPLYQGLGLCASDGFECAGIHQATLAVLGSHVEHVDTLPIINPATLRCHNGALTVYFRHGSLDIQRQPSLIERFERQYIVSEEAQEFINRLQKNLAHLKKAAKVDEVSNLRVYDADLPNYNVAIDLYGTKVHVQEYAPPKQIPADVAKQRFNSVLHHTREILGVFREDVFIKTRARQSGNDQYTKNSDAQTKRKKMYVVREYGAYFYVNFTDYLDTGLFIDHRNMRQMVAATSRGKRVLNLFSYTCTASVHAAMVGAKSVTSVDLSANYLDWGHQNFALNGLDLSAYVDGKLKYQFIASDVFEWIKEHTEQYEVIFIDPPTFSNSKKFKGTFDVQRDHVALINRAMNRLSADGVLYFSNNYTRFELDESLLARYEVVCLTDKTTGFDFNPKKPIHQSYQIRHKNGIKAIERSVQTHQKQVDGEVVKDTNEKRSGRSSFDKHGDRTHHASKHRSHQDGTKESGRSRSQQDKSAQHGLAGGFHQRGIKDETRAGRFDRQSKHSHRFDKTYANKDGDNNAQAVKKSTPKVRYEKIDGKLVAVAIENTKNTSEIKKYTIKSKS